MESKLPAPTDAQLRELFRAAAADAPPFEGLPGAAPTAPTKTPSRRTSSRRVGWLAPLAAAVLIAGMVLASGLILRGTRSGDEASGPTTSPSSASASSPPRATQLYSAAQLLAAGDRLLEAGRRGHVPRAFQVTGRRDGSGLIATVEPSVLEANPRDKLVESFEDVAKMPVTVVQAEDPGPGLPQQAG